MTEHVDFLLNYGVLGFFALSVMFALWRVGRVVGNKLFGDKDTPGYIDRYMDMQKEFFDGLTARDAAQMDLCQRHQEQLALMVKKVTNHDEKAALAIHEIHEIAEIHRDGNFKEGVDTTLSKLISLQKAGLQACGMCRQLADAYSPETKKTIDSHCDAIEEIIKKT